MNQSQDNPGLATPTQCLKAYMRPTPDRIFITTLSDDAARDLFQAWETGHSGCSTSLGGCGAIEAFTRLQQLQAVTRNSNKRVNRRRQRK